MGTRNVSTRLSRVGEETSPTNFLTIPLIKTQAITWFFNSEIITRQPNNITRQSVLGVNTFG